MSHSPYAFSQGVTSLTGAATIKVNASSGAITLTDVGVTAVNAGNGILVSQTTGSVTVSVNTASSVTYGSLSISNTLTLATNNIPLKFTTVSGNSVSFIQQNDDNFVMYSTNAAGAQRAIWSVYAASSTSNFTVVTPLTVNAGATISGVTTASSFVGTVNLAFTATTMSAIAFTDTNWTNLGGLSIPSAGTWRVYANLRIRESGASEYIKGGLFTSATSGTGAILNNGTSNERMLLERIAATSGFINMLCTPEWIVTMPTGLSYPYTIYFQVQSSASDAQGLNNNDANGRPVFNAMQIGGLPTAPSGTTINCY